MKERIGEVWDCGTSGVYLIVSRPNVHPYCDWEPHRVDKQAIHHKALNLMEGAVYTFVESSDLPFERGGFTRIA